MAIQNVSNDLNLEVIFILSTLKHFSRLDNEIVGFLDFLIFHDLHESRN